jgi:hypothetical protein
MSLYLSPSFISGMENAQTKKTINTIMETTAIVLFNLLMIK